MSTFASILSQLQNDSSKTAPALAETKIDQNAKTGQAARPTPNKPIALSLGPTKRKRDDNEVDVARKASRSDHAIQPTPQARKPMTSTSATKPVSQGYRSTLQNGSIAKGSAGQQQPSKPVPSVPSRTASNTTAAKPKRGFASLMAKAAAAQEASKAAGPDTIRHRTTDKLTKKDRLRMAQEAQRPLSKHGSPHTEAGSAGNPKATSFNGFKPRTTPVKSIPKVTYQGTMRADNHRGPKEKVHKRGEAQDKYGGYASWSDLDDAEDEEGSYDESGSDMEEAGYDEMMEEELKSARIARREDEQALREEERLKREKLERKKRLMALSNAATAKKRF